MVNMHGKAKYWEHFEVSSDIAICKIGGCKSSRVSGRRAQKPGEAKKPRIGKEEDQGGDEGQG